MYILALAHWRTCTISCVMPIDVEGRPLVSGAVSTFYT
jgi:hypothetical protein